MTLDAGPPLRQTTRQRGDVECFDRPRVEAADDGRQRLAPTDADPRPAAELIGGELGRHGRDGGQAVVALPLQLGNQHAAETELARQVARQSGVGAARGDDLDADDSFIAGAFQVARDRRGSRLRSRAISIWLLPCR